MASGNPRTFKELSGNFQGTLKVSRPGDEGSYLTASSPPRVASSARFFETLKHSFRRAPSESQTQPTNQNTTHCSPTFGRRFYGTGQLHTKYNPNMNERTGSVVFTDWNQLISLGHTCRDGDYILRNRTGGALLGDRERAR
jgi:hypothetical protein